MLVQSDGRSSPFPPANAGEDGGRLVAFGFWAPHAPHP